MSEPARLPEVFVEWQCASRHRLFEDLRQGRVPTFLAAHLPVVSTLNPPDAPFPIRSANKGMGLLPRPDRLPAYLERLEAAVAASDAAGGGDLEARIAAARALYDHPDDIDRTRLGTLEIFQGRTWHNLQADPRAAVLFTGSGPRYPSYQLDCTVDLLDGTDPTYRFLKAMRLLFERERFHVPQPDLPLAYLFHVRAVHDKTPRSRGRPRPS